MAKLADILRRHERESCPECGNRLRETHCDVCGYGLVKQTRDEVLLKYTPRV